MWRITGLIDRGDPRNRHHTGDTADLHLSGIPAYTAYDVQSISPTHEWPFIVHLGP